MKKIILLIHFTFCILNFSFSQNPLVKQWDFRFGGNYDDKLQSFQQTSDGGYILGGTSGSAISGDKTQPNQDTTFATPDFWIVKIDSIGNKQWDKTFGGTAWDQLSLLQQTADNGYILGGWSWSGIGGDKTQPTKGDWDYWIIKIDSLGNKQWDKDFGGLATDYLTSVLQTNDGGYILGGLSVSDSTGDKTQNLQGGYDYWIVKTDAFGNKQWDKDFGGIDNDELFAIAQTTDGNFILGGWSASGIGGDKTQTNRGLNDYWILKTDSIGNKLWDKTFGGSNYDYFLSLNKTNDGGFILGGYSYSDSSGDKTQPNWDITFNTADYWIVKTDSLGNKQWDKDFGGTNTEDEFGNISQTQDGGFLFAGSSYSNIGGNKTENNLSPEQSWIIKTDALGNIQWDKTLHTYSIADDEIGYTVQTKDGCYAMANFTKGGIGGDKTQYSQGNYDCWIIKFCDSTLTNLSPALSSREGITVFPNPFTNELTISNLHPELNRQAEKNKETEIKVYDVYSRIIYSQSFSTSPDGSGLKLQTSNWLSGFYFLEVTTNGSRTVQKIIKQ